MDKMMLFRERKPIERMQIEIRRGHFTNPVPPKREGGQHHNWIAILYGRDGHSGMIRVWVEREYIRDGAEPRFKAADVSVGDVLELAHDVTGGGPKGGKTTKAEARWFGVVRRVTTHAIEFDRYESEMDAFMASPRGEAVATGRDADTDWSTERQQLEQRLEADKLRLREVKAMLYVSSLFSIFEHGRDDFDNDLVDEED